MLRAINIGKNMETYKEKLYNYSRRKTSETQIGSIIMGGNNPIIIQSMNSTDTNDIENSVAQLKRIVDAGGDLVRLTTQGMKEVDSLKIIHNKVRAAGYTTPIAADIHFNANVADYAAEVVEKVRVNPGNFVAGIKPASSDGYSKEEYHSEFLKLEERFTQLIKICKTNKTAIRIGVNHGSLSERMLMTWGDTARGMTESCLEMLQICKKNDFDNIVISMKASNTVMMIESVRLLVEEMDKLGLYYPIHLGVTEAGDGEDGRVKSSVGIGALLAEGVGDTVRVSLSEEPELEIPVASKLVNYITERSNNSKKIKPKTTKAVLLKTFERRETKDVNIIGGDNLPIVLSQPAIHPNLKADMLVRDNRIVDNNGKVYQIYDVQEFSSINNDEMHFVRTCFDDLNDDLLTQLKCRDKAVIILYAKPENPVGEMRAFIHTLIAENIKNPVVLEANYEETEIETLQIKASADLGILFVDKLADGILIKNRGGKIPHGDILSLSFGILQAARVRTSKTEFISCPSCGRTLFDLQTVVAKVKAKTSHLVGLKIGIMGCIVNGPGEMADADYGYVGAAREKISLYRKHDCIERNVPAEEAVDRLIELIKSNGDWVEPPKE